MNQNNQNANPTTKITPKCQNSLKNETHRNLAAHSSENLPGGEARNCCSEARFKLSKNLKIKTKLIQQIGIDKNYLDNNYLICLLDEAGLKFGSDLGAASEAAGQIYGIINSKFLNDWSKKFDFHNIFWKISDFRILNNFSYLWNPVAEPPVFWCQN